jgi:phosphatidylinositol alpha 1,6-mannosyltransferase
MGRSDITAFHLVNVRIAIVTESFRPDVNGVAHSVVRVAEHLVRRGHHPLVIAPRPARRSHADEGRAAESRADASRGAESGADESQADYPVVRVPSVPMPGYGRFRLGMPCPAIRTALTSHRTELVHLASPFFLGARGSAVAQQLGVPQVAVYQTDVPGYARAYHAGRLGEAAAWRWLRGIHNAADRTLAPSTASAARLHAQGIPRVWLWGRGVDTERFDPAKRSAGLRRSLAPGGEVLVGYVGRLAVEKRVDLLAQVATQPGTRLVIVGSGPAEAMLRRTLPSAVFLGQRQGGDLAEIFASLDIFVHSGCYETFGQTIQEAAASGLPVVAPAVGGPLDLVQDGVTGYLVTPGDAAALATAVARLAADPVRRAAQGRAARSAVVLRSWAAVGDALIDHYSAVLAVAPRAAPQAGARA